MSEEEAGDETWRLLREQDSTKITEIHALIMEMAHAAKKHGCMVSLNVTPCEYEDE